MALVRSGPLKPNLFASRSLQFNLTPENICRATGKSRNTGFPSLLFVSGASLWMVLPRGWTNQSNIFGKGTRRGLLPSKSHHHVDVEKDGVCLI